jgi:hypothetical protein
MLDAQPRGRSDRFAVDQGMTHGSLLDPDGDVLNHFGVDVLNHLGVTALSMSLLVRLDETSASHHADAMTAELLPSATCEHLLERPSR